MKAKDIWVVVPLSRPNWLENVKTNFLQQSFNNKKLVIIENGDAVGACNKVGFKPDLLLQSAPHQADAKNTGLEALREKDGAEFWTTFDDDDYYGPKYLQELHDNSDKADIIGKCSIFTKTIDDKLRLLKGLENAETFSFHGPTISGWLKATLPFPNTGQWGEDMAQLYNMKDAGATFWATSRYNFIFQRHKIHKHTWHTTDHQISQCWYKFQERHNPKVVEFDVDRQSMIDIVCKNKDLPKGEEVTFHEWDHNDSPCYTYEKKRVGEFDDWINSQIQAMGMK